MNLGHPYVSLGRQRGGYRSSPYCSWKPRRSGGPVQGGMTMTYKPYKDHTDATGGGRLRRILLITDLESLASGLVREWLRDL